MCVFEPGDHLKSQTCNLDKTPDRKGNLYIYQTVSCLWLNIISFFFTFGYCKKKRERPELSTIVEKGQSFRCFREIVIAAFNKKKFWLCSSKKYPNPLQGGHFCFRLPLPWNFRSRGYLSSPLPPGISVIFRLGWVAPGKKYFCQKCRCTIILCKT